MSPFPMYPEKNSKSAQLAQRAESFMPGGNSRHSVLYPPYPVYAESGQGCRLTDVDGATRIDCVNNMSALIHGHGNADVIRALREQSERLLSAGAPTEVEIELAEIITSRVESVQQLRFCGSGSEAVMFACRIARAVTGKTHIAKVEGAYHGSYDAVEFSLSPDSSVWGDVAAPNAVPTTQGVSAAVQQETVILPFNDVDAARRILREHAPDLAAVLIDPLVSRMGFIAASAEFLQMVREVTAEIGAALIFDEVFSFRLGFHGAQGEVGIEPDLTTFGKVIGGGMPIGAVGGSRTFMSVFDHADGSPSVEHSGTYFANPMSMAAGAAALRQLTPDAISRLNAQGERFRNALRERFRKLEIDGYVAGAGSLSAVILAGTAPSNYREMAVCMASGGLEKGMALHRFLLNVGVQIIPPGGVVFSTPMTDDDVDEIVAAFEQGLSYIKKQHS